MKKGKHDFFVHRARCYPPGVNRGINWGAAAFKSCTASPLVKL